MSSLLHELKRRKVFRVAVVYAASGFVMLQAADLILPRLGVPEWALTLIVVLLLLGFPIALALASALELTADGVRVTPPSAADPAVRPPALLGRRTLILAALLIALGVGLGAGLFRGPSSRRDAAEALALLRGMEADGAPAWDVAALYTALGDGEHAIRLLERPFREDDPQLVMTGLDPTFHPLRADPRFIRILERLRLPIAHTREAM
jgi:hypothetical protein